MRPMKSIRAWMVLDSEDRPIAVHLMKSRVWLLRGEHVERIKIIVDPPRKGKGSKA